MTELPMFKEEDVSIISNNEDESGVLLDTMINRKAIRVICVGHPV
ncbi:hypothetical protein Tco_0324221, partial [Tanacetum coccineum]